jgi:hypothetical protein
MDADRDPDLHGHQYRNSTFSDPHPLCDKYLDINGYADFISNAFLHTFADQYTCSSDIDTNFFPLRDADGRNSGSPSVRICQG